MSEGRRLLLESAGEPIEGRLERGQGEEHRKPDRCGVGVVGRLREINVIVGVQHVIGAARMAEDLDSAVGGHLVHVHVGRGARPSLDHIDRELVMKRAGSDFGGGLVDGPEPLLGEFAETVIGPGRSLLDQGEGLDQGRVMGERNARDREVLDRPQGLHAPIDIGRHLPFAETVMLDPPLRHPPLRAAAVRARDAPSSKKGRRPSRAGPPRHSRLPAREDRRPPSRERRLRTWW